MRMVASTETYAWFTGTYAQTVVSNEEYGLSNKVLLPLVAKDQGAVLVKSARASP